MTNTARIISMMSPCCVVTKAWARPEKPAATFPGSTCAASFSTVFRPEPNDTPFARLNEIVTDGSWPEWFTVTGPTLFTNFATVLRGTSGPRFDRTQSLPNEGLSLWYCGSSSITTQYSFVDV